jgi:MFS family permease
MSLTTKQSAAADVTSPPPLTRGWAGFFAKFGVLRNAQRELWLTFGIKLLVIAAYSVTNKTLVLWLSSDLGYSDQTAGVVIGWIWAPAMTVCTLLAGSITDALGLRRTFFCGVCICLVARAVMVLSTEKWLALAGGLFPLVIGEALGTPVLIAATRRYSTTRQRSIAFSLIYTIMNVGFLIAARIYDYVRQHLGEYGHFNLFGEQISTYRTLFLVSFLFELSILIPIYFLRRGAEATDDGVRFEAERLQYAGMQFGRRVLLTVRDSALETVRLFKRLLGQSGFYRLLAFLLLIGFLKVIVM